ncbi:MAG TPA: formate dehydrogenase subunit gamma [Anaeromyxobacteraceae bacterium]|nr:formate dehydrogenase subunit gamma [Anaeromyxobacteraceae bacterium]
MADKSDLIIRHSPGERVSHWIVAVVFIFLFLSGLAMFHPFFFWLSFLFGGGQFMRWLHPLAGVLLAVLFYQYASWVWADNKWLPADDEWRQHMVEYMRLEVHAPEGTGKYNAGQKLMFWSMVPIIGVLFVTGIVLWQPWFAPYFPAWLRRVAGILHAISAFAMFVGIGIHWYAAYWTRGSIRAMVRGTVTRAWAKYHFPGWYREVAGKE